MSTFSDMINRAMEEKKHTIRSLEAATIEKYGVGKQISRSLISDYKGGKRAPTYVNAIMISELLDLNKKEFLLKTFLARQEAKKAAEKERFLEICHEEGIKITGREL